MKNERVKVLEGAMVDSDLWPYVIAAGTAIFAALFLLYAITRTRKRKGETLEIVELEKRPFKTQHIVTAQEARKAQNELRTLDLEREILSYAIRRLYEAQAEGKITEEERDRLASGYKERMMKIKTAISRSESVTALHELESMQDDLIKLFNERFDELNKKIEDLRTHVDIEPIREAPSIPREEKRSMPSKRQRRKPSERPPPAKTEAERRIEKIREEIEKVLERLGQIEVEA
jgi:hypothetical protein